MENYVKVVLYAYPLLKTVGKDYEEHIRNKAVLSYDSNLTAERLAEYLAAEILEMNRLEWLKSRVNGALEKLDGAERELLAIRYFGKTKGIRDFLKTENAKGCSPRQYFRRQQRLGQKLGELLQKQGVTKDVYEKDFAGIDLFRKIHKFVEDGKDRKISAKERSFLCGEGD